MARLPTVGGDYGNWGTVLNEYLETAHNADGTLKLDVQTIADLKAIDVATLTDKQQALVAGYTTPGDGGGGQFYYDAGASATANDGTIIAPTAGSGRWIRVFSGPVSVRWFGAKGDNVTDDAAAFQAALALRVPVYVPKGKYVIKSPINATNNGDNQTVIFGDGWTDQSTGSVIYAETGAIGLDFTGSQFVTLRDFSLVSHGRTTPATIGILFARATAPAKEYAQLCTIQNVVVDIAADMTAHGGLGTVGIYNKSAEIHHYNNVYIKADTAVFYGTNNPWNVTSAYQTISTTSYSCGLLRIDGATTLRSKSATCYPFYTANGYDIMLDSIYLYGTDSAAGVYATGAKNLTVRGNVESCSRVAVLRNTQNVVIDVSIADTEDVVPAPIYLGADYTTINILDLKITFLAGAVTEWSYFVEGHTTSYLQQVSTDILGDNGTVPLTNVGNVQGAYRKTKSATLTKGGFKDLHLTGAAVVEGTVVFDAVDVAGVANNSLFRDSADNNLKYKDAGGTVRALW